MPDFDFDNVETVAQGTGDDLVICAICCQDFSVISIARHLIDHHGFDAEEIANAEVIDNA